MKTWIATLAVSAVTLLSTAQANAQYVVEPGPLGRAWVGGGGIDSSPAPVAVQGSGFSPFPYSYWVAYPYAARHYVGYGNNDFPFYGTAYGSPSDPWTWPAMGRHPGQIAEQYGALPPW